MSSKRYELTATVKFYLTDEDIDDIMCAALEGGINYWCGRVDVAGDEYLGEYASEQISRGGSLILHDYEGGEVYELTRENFLSGMTLLVEQGLDRYHAVTYGSVDTGEIDAEIADCIVQLAIFGEVVYG